MAGIHQTYILPRMKYLIPATFVLGLFTLTLSYKLYISRPAKKKKMLRNEAYAEELWQFAHPQENTSSEDSRFQ